MLFYREEKVMDAHLNGIVIRIKKAAKIHRCFLCQKDIPKASFYANIQITKSVHGQARSEIHKACKEHTIEQLIIVPQVKRRLKGKV
jgi:hypothetical protein